MKALLTITLAFALFWANAQTTAVQPQQQIDALHRSKYPFVKLALLPHAYPLQDPALPQAQGLDFQESVALNLLKKPLYAIEVTLPTAKGELTLELYQADWCREGYTLALANPAHGPFEVSKGLHYRGVVKGRPESIVSLSIFQDEVIGMVSTLEDGNLSLAKYRSKQNKIKDLHVLYNEYLLPNKPDFQCFTPDGQRGYSARELEGASELRGANNCVNLYLEVDYDVFVDKGGLEATNRYVTAIFNEAATLYAKEGIKLNLAQLYVWNTISPYTAYDAYNLLNQFKNKRAGSFKADAGMLLSYKGGGGIAVVDGLCDPFNLGYAAIGKSYSAVPAYSFSVMVLAHELGHILGSNHTHVCVWNGNNTAIDGCPGFTDGGCAVPAVPKQGGTIMSYCHITQYGINFALGFGPQPGNVIRNRVATAPCMTACSTVVVPPPPCGEITFDLVLDFYGNETSWEILDATNAVVDRGGPYSIRSNGQKIQKKLCLPAGCYKLRMLDSRGDGICCKYGDGSFTLTASDSKILAQGSSFTREALISFCIDNQGRQTPGVTVVDPPSPLGCTDINFSNKVVSFGESQDLGTFAVGDNGKSLTLNGNAWKAVPLDYTITPNTFLEFEFRSTQKAEIQAIGFDEDMNLSTTNTFQLWGTQIWGYQDYNNYVSPGAWRKYTIPVGKKYTGDKKYLFFACDNDDNVAGANAQFRNVRIYENKPCSQVFEGFGDPSVLAYPNPADQYLTLQMEHLPGGDYEVQLLDLLGRTVFTQNFRPEQGAIQLECPVAKLPAGMYLYQVVGENVKQAGKFLVKHSK